MVTNQVQPKVIDELSSEPNHTPIDLRPPPISIMKFVILEGRGKDPNKGPNFPKMIENTLCMLSVHSNSSNITLVLPNPNGFEMT